MDKSKKYLAISFIVVLIAVIILSFVGMFLLKDKPVILQGQIEATEIRISGKLPGRIDTFLVKEGQNVKAGDTLVVINSPEALAKYQQVNALESIARFQNQKVDGGTRKQIIATVQQLWNKSKSDLELAKTTYNRIEVLYRDSVVSSQRRDEVKALYDAAVAGERAAWNQYQMALDGAQIQDRESARSLVNAAKGTVEEVAALLQDARLTAPATMAYVKLNSMEASMSEIHPEYITLWVQCAFYFVTACLVYRYNIRKAMAKSASLAITDDFSSHKS